ncbi:MAG: diacylglycerol kinase [Treponema sp.]|jgi:diacylglycerol kinase family enzyme|nr:diacylglycerol kinase [Treponema sp.]
MLFDDFGSLMSEICSHSPLSAGRPLVWTIIANPRAGGFTIRSRWKKHHAQLAECAKRANENPPREGGSSQTALNEGGYNSGLVLTKGSGHAEKITEALVAEAEAEVKAKAYANKYAGAFYLIITAGGDGTSLEVMTSLYHASAETRQNFAVLRLPMGTGNDGSDSWYLDKALDLIINPSELQKQRVIKLVTASGRGPFLAFNILSVGLDAFVTHMTNKMKGKLPGDSYKLWVDISALFYDKIYKVDYMDIRARDPEGKEVKAFREKLLLIAVGESGRRSYGSHKWILPDKRNVCAMRQMSLFRKLIIKGLFVTGKHVDEREAILWNAQAVEISAKHPLLAQMDGETVLLEEKDYPAVIELTEPVIPIIKGSGTRDRGD